METTGADVVRELYHGDRTWVTRIVGQDGRRTVIRKQMRGLGGVARAEHEAGLLRRLGEIPGVVHLARPQAEGTEVYLQDSDRVPLAEVLVGGTLPPDLVIRLVADLARTLAAVHRAGVVHKDVNPTNILVRPTGTDPLLIDFDLASTFAEERPGFTHHRQITGTLAYLAPEQSGRTAWTVDHRADLYSLGATTYQLLSGVPPFGFGIEDPLAAVHAHLADLPADLAETVPGVSPMLAAIVARLLEKEPDRRYQSAEGLAHDLAQAAAGERSPTFVLGSRDFPLRLSAPSRLIGRDAELSLVRQAYAGVSAGSEQRGLLVAGAPGVGKTALLDELRPWVTAGGGWFVTGKSDQYRHDHDTDAVVQAMRALGRLLLAEPEDGLRRYRNRLMELGGTSVAALAASVPELAVLLGVSPSPWTGDPAEAVPRLHRAFLDLVAVVASPERPLVIIIDDLQWASAFTLGGVDAILTDPQVRGVLLVGAFRDGEVDPAHPLSAMADRWERTRAIPPVVHLSTLPTPDLQSFLTEMLQRPTEAVAELTEAVGRRTVGNPFDTVELINALRRDGVLRPDLGTWNWDRDRLRTFVGAGDVLDLLSARLTALPEPTQRLVRVIACLGGDVDLEVLAVAAGPDPGGPEAQDGDAEGELRRRQVPVGLLPALEDGLLVMGGDEGTLVRFRHDRVQQAAYGTAPDAGHHLALARNLASGDRFADLAAEQYLHALTADPHRVSDPAEALRVVGLLRGAARQAHQLANFAVMDRFLEAATDLIHRVGDAAVPGPRALVELDVERHAARFGLGRLAEADVIYAQIAGAADDPVLLAQAGWAQVTSLTSRGRPAEALALGGTILAALGHPVPAPGNLPAAIDRGLDELQAWAVDGSEESDRGRPENTDRQLDAVGRVVNRMIPPSFFVGSPLLAWLVALARRLWAEGGPAPALIGPLAHTSFVMIGLRQDYRSGYRVLRRVLEQSRTRGYEPATSEARFLGSLSATPWFDPLEEVLHQARLAREGLLRAGDVSNATFTYFSSLFHLVECGTLDELLIEARAGLELTERTGNAFVSASLVPVRQLVLACQGQTHGPGRFTDDGFAEEQWPDALGANWTARSNYHLSRALSALIFNDLPRLVEHAQAAIPLMRFVEATQSTLQTWLLQSLALAGRLRQGAGPDRPVLVAELEACRAHLAARAEDAPANFAHLRDLVDAEYAWARGDYAEADLAFDRAQRLVAGRQRWWQRGLIAEHRARFHLEYGLEHSGRDELWQARQAYADWGAVGKIARLDEEFPFLATRRRRTSTVGESTVRGPGHSGEVTSEGFDLMAVLRAFHILGVEAEPERLQRQVVEVLRTLTGATSVRLLLWEPDTGDWVLADPEPVPAPKGPEHLPLDRAVDQGLVPASVFRYVRRTQEPLVLDDATRDERFSADRYLRDLRCCALLAVPVLARGVPRAMLLLENRMTRGAFSPDRLEAVLLIAGQLAASLDDALAARFRSLVQRSGDLTVVCDREGTIAYASAASGELLGCENTDVVGTSLPGWVSEEAGPIVRERLGQVEADEPAVEQLEVRHRDGSLRWSEVTFTDLTADAAVNGVMVHLRDITERRRLEQELRHAQKLESVGQLSSGIAHEINTPIQFIRDNVTFLSDALAELAAVVRSAAPVSAGNGARASGSGSDVEFLLEEIPQALAESLEGINRVATIVQAMKAFGHPGGEAKSEVDLNRAVSNTLVVATAEVRHVAEVVTDLAHLPLVWCSQGDLNQVILNLVINSAQAMRAMSDAGGPRGTLTVRTRVAGDDVLIEVQDTGGGIPPEIQHRVFEQFFTTKEVGVGTGQGLALAYALVHDRHGGTLTFVSEAGVGTTFTVRLPIRPPVAR